MLLVEKNCFRSGTAVSDVNRLVKQQQDMARMMKKMGKMGGLGGLKNMMSSLGGASPNPGLGGWSKFSYGCQ